MKLKVKPFAVLLIMFLTLDTVWAVNRPERECSDSEDCGLAQNHVRPNSSAGKYSAAYGLKANKKPQNGSAEAGLMFLGGIGGGERECGDTIKGCGVGVYPFSPGDAGLNGGVTNELTIAANLLANEKLMLSAADSLGVDGPQAECAAGSRCSIPEIDRRSGGSAIVVLSGAMLLLRQSSRQS